MARAVLEIRKLGVVPIEGDVSLPEGVSCLVKAFCASQQWIEELKRSVEAARQQCIKIAEKMKALNEASDVSSTEIAEKSEKSEKSEKPSENGVDGECEELVDAVKRMVSEAQTQ